MAAIIIEVPVPFPIIVAVHIKDDSRGTVGMKRAIVIEDRR